MHDKSLGNDMCPPSLLPPISRKCSDMYRVLLAQETNKDLAASADGGGERGPSAATVKAAVEEAEAMRSRVHELERVSRACCCVFAIFFFFLLLLLHTAL